jgi:uncharacterized membrane protein YbhN (UPF0104 family)
LRKFTSALKIGVSLAILLFLFRKANLSQSVRYLGELRYSFVLLSVVLIVLGQVVRAHRLAIMVFGESARRKIWLAMRVQMVSFLPGMVSPAKIGEVAKVYMLQSEADVPMSRGLACFVAERVLDVLLLGPLALVGLFVFFRSGLRVHLRPGGAHVVILVALALAVGLVTGYLWARRRGTSLADLWRTVSPGRLIEAGAMTALYWGVVFLEVWCFCKAALFDARVWHTALVVPPALLSSMVPITFSGFGLREAAMIILLQRPPVGTNYEQAFLVSLMYAVIGLGVPALMGVFFWMMGKRDVAQQA